MTEINALHVLLLNRIGEVGQNTIAAAMKVNEGTISRVKNGEGGVHLSGMQVFFDQLGLKVVEKNAITVDEKEIESLRYLAGKYIFGEKK